jgi:hypothetical protein
MISKIKNIALLVIVVVCIIGIITTLFKGCNKPNNTVFKHTIDSLHKQNDSLLSKLEKTNLVIDSLKKVDNNLTDRINHQKTKIITITQQVAKQKDSISKLVDSSLVIYFNQRYPTDTINNKLKVAQQVLTKAAEDLVDYDGNKKILTIKDSIIDLDSIKLINKDNIISNYIFKEKNYKQLIYNKDLEVMNWSSQYTQLTLENKKLRTKNKLHKIVDYIIVGGLVYTILRK